MKNTILNQLFSSCKKWKTLVLISTLLTLGVGQTWAYEAHFSLMGDPLNNSWAKDQKFMINTGTDKTDEWYIYAYVAKNQYFALNNGSTQYGPSTNEKEIKNGSGGGQGSYNSNSWKFTGTSGIVKICCAESENREWYPWVWVEESAPTINFKHPWNGGSWTEQTATKQTNGTYMYKGQYGGIEGFNAGYTNNFKYNTSATTLIGSPVSGDYCYFIWNPVGYVRGTQDYANGNTQSVCTGTFTIIKLCNITYQGNGETSGTVPSAQNDNPSGTAVTLRNGGDLAKTGYTLTGWNTASDGSGTHYDLSDSFTPSTETSLTLYAEWTPITLSATISPSTINANTATAIQFTITTNVPLSSGYYFEISNWGNKNSGTAGGYNIDGDHQITLASPFTHDLADGKTNLAAGTYKIKLKITKNAVLQVESDLITLVVSSSTYSVTVNAGAGGNVSTTSISASPDSWSGDITATPNTGYRFNNWTSSGGGIIINNSSSATTQIKATSTGGTLTANFSAATYRVTLDNQSATTAGTEYVDATYNTTTLTSITKPTKTNYTFGGYYTETGGNGTQIIDANGNWLASQSGFTDGSNKSLITGNKTLYAKWTETMSTLTTSNHYDVGNPGYAAPTVSNSATNVGYETTRTITATAAGTGYTFAGWTLTNCTRTDGGAATATTITIRSNGDGAAATAQANYNEDLTSRWHLVGNSSDFPDGWAVNNTTMMQKKTGHSTESAVYFTINVTSTGTQEFKIVDDNGDGNDIWYGYSTGNTYLTWTETSTKNVYTGDGNANNLKYTSTVVGSYEFKVDYSGTYPAVTITYPTAYTVTYGVGTDYTSMGGVSTTPSISSGDYVIAGTEITFTATPNLGYKFVGWYNDAACTGDAISTDATYNIASLGATTTLYAKFDYRPLYIHADWIGWETTAAMTQSTENRAVYTYTYDNMEARTSAQEGGAWNIGYHFRIMNAANGADQYLAYNYDGVQEPTYTATIVDGVHKTAAGNPTIEFGLTKKSCITITLTLQSPDDSNKPTVNIAADAYYNVSTAKGGNGAAGITINPTSVEARSGANSAEITATIAPGYTFTNWTADASITINSPNATTTTVRAASDGTLTANATANSYAVHFDGNGNTGGFMSDLAARTYGVAFKLTSNGFTKTGYTFAGWATEAAGDVVYTNGQQVSNLTNVNNGTVNLYAKWTPATYTVSFNNNGGSGATPASKQVTYDAAYGELPAGPTPPRAGSFIGWYTASTGGTQVTAETIVSTASDHTLYARFESTFTVTVQYKCGSDVLHPQTTTNASEVSVAAEIVAPEILGYKFVNWTGDNATFANAESATTTVNVTAATTIVANYAVVPMVYFKNNLGWDDVYVSFDNTWNTVGGKNVPSNNGKPYYKMTQLGKSDIYYCVIPTTYTENNYANWAWNIAFDNTNYGSTAETTHTGTWDKFYGGQFLGRGDFDPNATMYIPYDGDTETRNAGTYYPTGCWLQYNTNYSGYKVRVNTYVQGAGGSEVANVQLTSSMAGATEFTAKVYLGTANHVYGVMLYKDYKKNTNDIWYTNTNDEANTITSATTSLPWSWKKCEETWQRCRVKTESLGEYIFTVSFATGRPMVDIEYPVSVGDYRLVYKDRATWNIAHDENWSQTSAVFKKKANRVDTASFFVSHGSSPALELQKCTAIDGKTGAETWEKQGGDVPLTGITKAGVYNFTVTQNADASSATSAYLGAYSGKFYVRTDVSDGGWNDYESSANAMTYTEYSMEHSSSSGPYSYYFMRHVTVGQNVKFVVANDYSQCLTDYMIDDDFTKEWIEAEANIRFTYNHTNNQIHRAYISGSSYIYDRFLVLEGDEKLFDADGNALNISDLNPNEINFTDDQNWIYETTVQAKPLARIKLTAKFNGKIQYFYGAESETYQLIGGTGETKYKMRVVYDFKTDRLLAAWLPNEDISASTAINADVMIIRYHQEDAQQITFSGSGELTEVKTVYGVMQFNKYRLNNQDETGGHGNLTLSPYERDLFFISFPFDVKLNDVFGFGQYGKHWIIEYYDGKTRAKNGYWKDSPTNWKFVTKAMKDSYTLKANEGYVLALDLDELKPESSVWEYNVENVYLYFPSTATVENIQATTATVEIDQTGYECTINRNTPDGDRRIKDSYWHLLGVPSYANASNNTSGSWSGTVPVVANWTTSAPYVYNWNAHANKFGVISSTSTTFKPMRSYLAQYAQTTIKWASVNTTPKSVAARRNANYKDTYEFRLQLMQNDEELDHTFISLRDNEEVTSSFDFNYDLCKMMYGAFTSKSNIYTFAGNEEVAANCLPYKDETTIVPVGLTVDEEGVYIFSIPEGTNGVGVTLVDNERQTRTNLALTDYTVSLEKGTYDQRFVLEISPIEQIVTNVELINGENGDAALNGEKVTGVSKKLIDGVLYIIKDGKVFDARGARIQ